MTRSALERLDELTLTNRRFGRRIVEALGRKHDPTVLDGFDGTALDSPHAVVAFDHARASTRWQEQAQALGKRRDVLAAHPARNTGSLGTKKRFAENRLDGLDARRIEGVVALQVAQLGRYIDDIARGRAVAKVDQDRGSDLRLVGKGLRNAVGKRLGQCTRRDVRGLRSHRRRRARVRVGLRPGRQEPRTSELPPVPANQTAKVARP